MSNRNFKGRPKGVPNNTTKDFQKELIPHLKGEYFKIGKHLIGGTDPETRLRYLLRFAKIILPKGVTLTPEGEEIREIIYKQLKPEYEKISKYMTHSSTSDKSKVMIELTKLLTPQQQGNLLSK
jgi:hypothetical protein